jgi:predicted metalloprotease with PDZ domain
LLDLLLLKKSKGKRGLREVINELSEKYGPHRPFDEANFFNELVDITYPEVRGFIDRYIEHAEPLPVKEYFNYVGINYTEFAGYDSTKASLGLGLTVSANGIVISKANEDIKEIKAGDILKTMDHVEITLQNAQEAFGKLHQKKAGDSISFSFLRGNETIDVDLILPAEKITHQFEVMTKPKRKQLNLRERWLRNLAQK